MTRAEPPVHGLILAAGASSRMGRPKALLPLDGGTLVGCWCLALARAGLDVVVVLGAHRGAVEAALPPGVRVVFNPDWTTTHPADSLRLALQTLPVDHEVLVSPVDVPPPPSRVLQALLQGAAPVIPTFEERSGHPVRVGVGAALEALEGGTLRDATAGARRLAVDWPGVVRNLNRPGDWEAWLAQRSGAGTKGSGP